MFSFKQAIQKARISSALLSFWKKSEEIQLLKRRNQILETLNELSLSISTTLEANIIFDAVARITAQAVGATSAYVSIWDGSKEKLTVVAEYISPEASAAERVSDLGAVYELEDLGETSEWFSIRDYYIDHVDDSDLSDGERAHMIKYGAKSLVGIPLISGKQVFGMIELWESRHKREFRQDEIRLIQAVASQVAMSIENARLHEQLAKDEWHYRQTVEGSLTPIFAVDKEGRIKTWNEASQTLFMYDDSIIGQNYDILRPTIETPEAARQIISLVFEEKSSKSVEVVFQNKDGAERITQTRLYPLIEKDGSVSICIFALTDITKRKLAETAELQQRIFAEALRDTATVLNSTLELNEVLDRILDNVQRVVPHSTANIMLVDKGFAHIAGRRGYQELGFTFDSSSLRYSVEETPSLKHMAKTRQPFIIPNVKDSDKWLTHPDIHWIHSYLGAPIHLSGELLGFLNLDSIMPIFFYKCSC